MTESHNTWLYAVVPADRPPPAELSGVAGEPLRAVAGADLTALAGSVPCADFDEEPLRAHLEDAAWLERTARAHHRVIDALARAGPTLPLRFATLYRDDGRAAAMLRERRGELLAALRRITDRTEWGVKAYLADPSATGPQDEPGGADEPAGESQRPGTAYLLRRRAQRQERGQALHRALDEAELVHTTLSDTAAESTQHPLQSAEATGHGEPMVLNGAYLVDDIRLTELDRALVTLAVHHPALRLEVTGPWPPYSFSGIGADPGRG
ncbi:GvpL/GvpF family gas vesicle protein [Kitasatospora sp. NPDC004240]